MKIIKTKNKLVSILILCLISGLFPLPSKCEPGKTQKLREIEAQTQIIRKKIDETKQKEKIAITRLTEIQKKLYATQEQLRKNKFKLTLTQTNLEETEQKLAELKFAYMNLRINAQKRIKQIYQGQRLKMLEILLRSPNLTDFQDNLFYQKQLLANDKYLLKELEEQSKEIEDYKDKLAEQKINIASIVSDIDKQKQRIAKEHSAQSVLVTKLRTERASYEKAERQLEKESDQLISEINRLVGKFASSPYQRGTGRFSYPVFGRLTSPFGPRRHPIHRVISFHSGIDLAAPYGTPVMASDSGRVIYNGWYGGYGRVVILDHGKNLTTLYAHLSRSNTSNGRDISKGQTIGFEGQTGYSTGPHVHFEVRRNGKPENPLNHLQ